MQTQTAAAKRPLSTPKGEVADPEAVEGIIGRYSPADRVDCADKVFGSIPRQEFDHLKGIIVIQEGYGSSGHDRVFRWLCVAAMQRGTDPVSLAECIAAAESAKDILL